MLGGDREGVLKEGREGGGGAIKGRECWKGGGENREGVLDGNVGSVGRGPWGGGGGLGSVGRERGGGGRE